MDSYSKKFLCMQQRREIYIALIAKMILLFSIEVNQTSCFFTEILIFSFIFIMIFTISEICVHLKKEESVDVQLWEKKYTSP